MKKIERDKAIFLSDIEANQEYYQHNSLCSCSLCRNFYAQISGKYQELEDFLLEFGVDIVRPDELVWTEAEETIDYIAMYTVKGDVLFLEEKEFLVGEQNIMVDETVNFPNEQVSPCFGITVFSISLPWVLDKSLPHSPKKRWRLLKGIKRS